MPASLRATMPGLNKFNQNLREIDVELSKELTKGLKEAAQLVADVAKVRAPRSPDPPRTTHMADSIQAYGSSGVSQVKVNATRRTQHYGARGGDKTVHKSIRTRKGKIVGVRHRVGYENPYRYPRIVEFGNGAKIKPRPFLYNTAEELRPVVEERIRLVVEEMLIKYWARKAA